MRSPTSARGWAPIRRAGAQKRRDLTYQKGANMRSIVFPLIATALAALPAVAQTKKPDMKGATIVASEPGRAAAARAAEVSAQIVSIDKKTRTIGLKGKNGKVVEIVAG